MSEQARFEIPKEMRNMAEASLQQTRKTFDKLLTGAEAAAGSMEQRGATVRAGARDIGTKAIAFAEKNVRKTNLTSRAARRPYSSARACPR